MIHPIHMKNLIALFILAVSLPSLAHDTEQMGKVVGDKIELSYSDHAAAGQVNGHLVFASPLVGKYGIQLTHRTQGQDFVSSFTQVTGGYAGTIDTLNEAGDKTSVEVKITKVAPKLGRIEGTVAGKSFVTTVSAKEMQSGHFVNPNFLTEINGRKFEFNLENGLACMACSLKIVYVVLGMLGSTGAF